MEKLNFRSLTLFVRAKQEGIVDGLWFIYPKLKLCYWEEHGNRENKKKLAERKAFDDSMTNVATLASFIRNL